MKRRRLTALLPFYFLNFLGRILLFLIIGICFVVTWLAYICMTADLHIETRDTCFLLKNLNLQTFVCSYLLLLIP